MYLAKSKTPPPCNTLECLCLQGQHSTLQNFTRHAVGAYKCGRPLHTYEHRTMAVTSASRPTTYMGTSLMGKRPRPLEPP